MQVKKINTFEKNKSLGQHFLNDKNILKKILNIHEDLTSGTIIEIGPGMGSLTKEMLNKNAKIIAVEKDIRLKESLLKLKKSWPSNLELIFGDALKIDIPNLGNKPRRIIANLPYNIGTELLVRWLEKPKSFSSITVMLQKEVAERVIANHKSKNYGRLSVLSGWHWNAKLVFTVKAKSFNPPPKVDSAIVYLAPKKEPVIPVNLNTLSKVTHALFSNRRKMIRSGLRKIGDPDIISSTTGIDISKRPQQLTIKEFCKIALFVKKK